ncbi:MAG: cupredoxin domain-containing protein [Candidatus Limnocylindrales bacterium]
MREHRFRRAVAGSAIAMLVAGIGAAAPVAAATPQTWNVDAGAGDATGVSAAKFYTPTLTIDAGDTVTWKVGGNAHTIAFLAPAQALPGPEDPTSQAPAGGTSYDGTTFTNSGIVVPVPGHNTYSLTFPTSGSFAYHCLIHPGMSGNLTVNPAGTAYPQDQAAVTAAAQTAEAADIATGHQLEASFTPTSTTNADGTKTYSLAAGVGANGISILRFISSSLHVRVGDSVTWTNVDSSGEPHSVSFGTEPHGPTANAPAGGSTYAGGSAFVSSGLFLGAPIPGPHAYTLKFTKAGSYNYICVLHDVVGMVGSINVAATTTGSNQPPPTSAAPVAPTSGGGSPLLPLLAGAALAAVVLVSLNRRRVRAD